MRSALALSVVFSFAATLNASQDSNSSDGIDVDGARTLYILPLEGGGQVIGQVEPGRPGSQAFGDGPGYYNTTIKPFLVLDRLNLGPSEFGTGDDIHAENVAGVMISTDILAAGVAPSAQLYAVAGRPIGTVATEQDQMAVATQLLIDVTREDQKPIRAINMSFGIEPANGTADLNGNQLLTQYIDWSARQHDVLYIVAGNEFRPDQTPLFGMPTDNFNGMTVAFTKKDNAGVYNTVSTINDFGHDAVGDRTSISILVPGENIDLYGPMQVRTQASATSFAAPMLTGSVALLHNVAVFEKGLRPAGWNDDAHKHQVIKAVLMNSADKLKDDGMFAAPGKLLGMQKTILDTSGNNWLQSVAYDDDFLTQNGLVALDPQMGTGQLNVKRALQQYIPGEFHKGGIPTRGWDFGHSSEEDQVNRYVFNRRLDGGSFISVTLAFDREVEFQTGGANGIYHSGDTFVESGDVMNPGHDQYSDLDVYLVPKGSFSINDAVAASRSFVGTVDHIFFQIPAAGGEYELWVHQFNENAGPVDYGLAWWALGTGPALTMAGDWNFDEEITSDDINAMLKGLSDLTSYKDRWGIVDADLMELGDLNGDDLVTNLDIQPLLNLVASLEAGSGSLSAVPEPATWILFGMALPALGYARLVRRL